MKPVEHTISDASFIGHYFRLLRIRLRKFKNLKHVVLIGVVLFCMLARYIVLLGDPNPVQNKPESVTEKFHKINSRIFKLQLVPTNLIINNQLFYNSQIIQFDNKKSNPTYFTAKYVP